MTTGHIPRSRYDVCDWTDYRRPRRCLVRDLSWSAKIRWLKDGMNNLWASLLLWRECGWSPWAR